MLDLKLVPSDLIRDASALIEEYNKAHMAWAVSLEEDALRCRTALSNAVHAIHEFEKTHKLGIMRNA